MIPEIGYLEHKISYTPESNQDIFKMTIERSNTKIKLYEAK